VSSRSSSETRCDGCYDDSPYCIKISEVLRRRNRDDAENEWVGLYNAGRAVERRLNQFN
jgi:hypothetical protein